MTTTLMLLAAMAVTATSDGAADTAPLTFSESRVIVGLGGGRLALRDMDGDAVPELLEIGPQGIALRRLTPDIGSGGGPGFPAEAPSVLKWPARSVAWDVADIDADGAHEIVLFEGGRAVRTYGPDADDGLTLRSEVIAPEGGYMPPGIRHVRFARDIDDDGRTDLVIPSTDRYLIYLADGDGGFADPIEVGFRPDIDLDMGDPDRLDDRFGQEVRIPWFTLQDCDGDGRSDLKSITDAEAAFYIAAPEIPTEPTWRLDLATMQDDRPITERLDLDNVLGILGDYVNWRFADLDGRPPNDLVMHKGGTFKLYLDGSRGPELGAPDQVLKASGNVLYFQLRDVDGDGGIDLQLVRADNVSLGRILRWLVLAGSLEFRVFTYGNTGSGFTRRPIDDKTIMLRIPALLGFADEFEEMGDQLEERSKVPARAACLHGDDLYDDVVDIQDGRVRAWFGGVPAGFEHVDYGQVTNIQEIDAMVEDMLLDDLDQLDAGAERTLDLAEIDELVATPGWDLREANADRPADVDHALEPAPGRDAGPRTGGLRVTDLDGDGVSDIVVVSRHQQRTIVRFLVSRPGR